jgi:AraC-like DNA-binding protein
LLPRLIQTPCETFAAAPVGRFCVVGTSVAWCASPSLGGVILWGRQSEAETRAILDLFERCLRAMAPSFDMILDTRGVEAVDPVPLGILFAWMVAHLGNLAHRLRLQACIIREGPLGLLLTGLMPVTGQRQPYRIFLDPAEAFTVVAGDAGAALCAEVDGIALGLRDVPREVRLTREILEAHVDTPFEEVSRRLGMSPRSLQRALGRHGTSFHNEVVAERLTRAKALLRSGDLKLGEIGARVGISERALGLLFRARTGLAPAEWRKRDRG